MFTRAPTRVLLLSLALLLVLAPSVEAQEPQDAPSAPEWGTDLVTNSMVLTPTMSRLALGLSEAHARLQVVGQDVSGEPESGYLVLGGHQALHMKLDRNDIQVAGGSVDTVGSLYLQRFGGPLVVHGSMDLDKRIYVTQDGLLGVGCADPRAFAVDHGFLGAGWPHPKTAMAVDGDVYMDRGFSDELRVLERLRVGKKIDLSEGGAFDYHQKDSLAMIGGKLTAQEIVVHIINWADDVFADDYPLMPLAALETYVEREGHLPDVPTTAELRQTGLDLGEANAMLLRKVEELTLYTIDQEREIGALEDRLEALEARLDALEDR